MRTMVDRKVESEAQLVDLSLSKLSDFRLYNLETFHDQSSKSITLQRRSPGTVFELVFLETWKCSSHAFLGTYLS